MEPLGWFSGYTDAELRAALRTDLPIVLHGQPDLSRPTWASARATVGDSIFAKLAFAHETAVRIWREARVLGVLAELKLAVPELVASSPNPAFSATRLIRGGSPLGYEAVAAAAPGRIDELASQLAAFLAQLHAVRMADRVDDLPRVPEQSLHVTTDDLRARFTTLIAPLQQAIVRGWCDWIDDELARGGETVYVHGDFHPYNQLWDLDEPRLLAVVDYETSGLGERELDFRVLPVFGPGPELLAATVDHYEHASGHKLRIPRILAYHVLNHLGDSLWRTEAGAPAPGGSPSDYVEVAARNLSAFGIAP
jgi:aminoglycoside phosphotransferase (APT) family kinase protein